VDDLRWSPDGRFVTFTETHYHPAVFHAADIGPGPDPLDFTSVVREYALATGRTVTLAMGEDAWVAPESARLPWRAR
jgi:hypothetical protein